MPHTFKWPAGWIQPKLNVIATIQLSLAALGSSWCSYQASRWGGIQATTYSEASALRGRASRFATQADQIALLDIAMFTRWLEADARGDSAVASFFTRHFRPEFAIAFRDWRSQTATSWSQTTILPFTLPSYHLAATDSVERLEQEATRVFARGQDANRHSDGYVFTTVLLAAVLFCAGSAQQIGPAPTRVALVAIATAMLIIAAVDIFRYPFARG